MISRQNNDECSLDWLNDGSCTDYAWKVIKEFAEPLLEAAEEDRQKKVR